MRYAVMYKNYGCVLREGIYRTLREAESAAADVGISCADEGIRTEVWIECVEHDPDQLDDKHQDCSGCICLIEDEDGESFCDEEECYCNDVLKCPEGMFCLL